METSGNKWLKHNLLPNFLIMEPCDFTKKRFTYFCSQFHEFFKKSKIVVTVSDLLVGKNIEVSVVPSTIKHQFWDLSRTVSCSFRVIIFSIVWGFSIPAKSIISMPFLKCPQDREIFIAVSFLSPVKIHTCIKNHMTEYLFWN